MGLGEWSLGCGGLVVEVMGCGAVEVVGLWCTFSGWVVVRVRWLGCGGWVVVQAEWLG